ATAESDERERQRIIAGQNEEIAGNLIEDRAHLGDAARSFLDADDVFDLREANDGGGLNVDTSAALNAVENDRQIDASSDSFEMLVETLLRRFVVVGRDREEAVGAKRFEFTRESDYFSGVVAAGAGEDWHFTLGEFECDFDHAEVLLA